MRLAVYKDNLSTGRGADRAVKNFAADMAARGHDVILFEKNELADRLNERWDIIVATGSNEAVDLYRNGYFERRDRSKVVLQLHLAPRGFFKWRHPWRNHIIKKAFKRVDAAQVLCGSYEGEFRALARLPKIATIGNYSEMSIPDFAGDVASCRTILYPAATLNKVKNQKLLIKAFALIADEFPEWNVRLLGKDSTRYADECRDLIRREGLDGQIEIAGFVDSLQEEYRRAAFVAFPSNLEGFPLAVLEAAKFSLCAVVQKKLPGAMDIVKDGETGTVSAPDVVSYAHAMRSMMKDAEGRAAMGRKAFDFCAKMYSREVVLDKWDSFLKSVLN